MRTRTVTTLSSGTIDSYHGWLCAKGLSERTASAYASDLRMLLRDLEQETLEKLDYEESAMNWLTGNRKKMALKTTSRRLTSVRGFAKWAGWGVVLDEYHAPTGGPGQPHPIPEGMDGIRRMLHVAKSEQQRALVALCGFLGCRVSEALATKPSNFDLDRMILRVLGKGEKVRYVPISSEAWDTLASPVIMAMMTSIDTPVVGLEDRVARGNITQMGVRAGLARHVASHDLRATFATAIYDKTKDMRLVQQLLGHSSVETTQIYVGTQMAHMREAVEL